MEEEIGKLKKFGTFGEEMREEQMIGKRTKWVFEVQRNERGEIYRLRARLVAKGYSQMPGLDFGLTYAPVSRISSLRILLELSAKNSYTLRQCDGKSAFLNADLKEELYVEVPDGYEARKGIVALKLDKAIYGLKQAAYEWHRMLNEFLEGAGFQRSPNDTCLYKAIPGGQWRGCYAFVLHVDDITSAVEYEDDWERFEVLFRGKFQLKEVNLVKWYLGVHITQDKSKRVVEVDQEKYIDDLLLQYEMLIQYTNHGKCRKPTKMKY